MLKSISVNKECPNLLQNEMQFFKTVELSMSAC